MQIENSTNQRGDLFVINVTEETFGRLKRAERQFVILKRAQ